MSNSVMCPITGHIMPIFVLSICVYTKTAPLSTAIVLIVVVVVEVLLEKPSIIQNVKRGCRMKKV